MLKKRFLLFVALLTMPSLAFAGNVGLSTILTQFQSVTNGWYHAIFTDALDLFGALFLVEFTWLVVQWLIGGKDVHEIYTSFIRKLITIGFFYSVLLYSSQWVPWLIDGFKNVAISAGGEPITTLGYIVSTGIKAFVTCVEAPYLAAAHDAGTAMKDLWNLNFSGALSNGAKAIAAADPLHIIIELLVGLMVGVVLIFAFGYLALELLSVQLEGMIIFSLGVIMLGFGAARWTARFVESYLQYALAIGVRLMVLTLWASFIEWQVDPLIKNTLIQGNASLTAYGIVLILAMLILLLTKKLPAFANSILTGSSALTGNEMFEAVKGGVIAAGAAAVGAAGFGAGSVAALGSTAAGTLGASEAAAGAAEGAGAATAAGELSAAEGEAGASGVAAPGSKAADSDGSGVQPPKAQQTASGGVQPPKSGGSDQSASAASDGGVQPSAVARDASGSDEAKSAGQTDPAASSDAQAPSGSGGQPVGSGSGGRVSGGAQTPSPAPDPVVQRLDQLHQKLDAMAQGKPKTFGEQLEEARQSVKRKADAMDVGKPHTGGVSAPSIGVKHLSD